jgi:hypothetical protein
VPRDAEQFGASIVGRADRGEPRRATPQDLGRNRNRFDVVDRGRTAVEPDIGRERRLEARHPFSFQTFEQRGLLAANVGAGAIEDVQVEIVAVQVVLADQPGLVGLLDRHLQPLALRDELPANVDVGRVRPVAKLAIRQPSIKRCGSWRRRFRSLQLPGSDSSALATR